MSQTVTQEVILQAILELSAQVKESRNEWKADIKEVKDEICLLKSDVAILKSDVATLKTDVETLKSDVGTLKSDVATLKSDVATLKEDVASIKVWMVKTDERLETIDAKMDVFTKGLLDTQAEVVKLKKAL